MFGWFWSSLEIANVGLHVLYWLVWAWVVLNGTAALVEDRGIGPEGVLRVVNLWGVFGFWFWLVAILRYEPDLMFMFRVSLFALILPRFLYWAIPRGFFPSSFRDLQARMRDAVERRRARKFNEILERNYRETRARIGAWDSYRLENEGRAALPPLPAHARGTWWRIFLIVINIPSLVLSLLVVRTVIAIILLSFIPYGARLWYHQVSSNPLDLLLFMYFLVLYLVSIIWILGLLKGRRVTIM